MDFVFSSLNELASAISGDSSWNSFRRMQDPSLPSAFVLLRRMDEFSAARQADLGEDFELPLSLEW